MFGGKKLNQTIQRLHSDISALERRGDPQFTVSFTESEIGLSNRKDVATGIIVEELQKMGHQITDTGGDPWGSVVFLSVANAQAAPKQPTSTPPSPYATTVTEELQKIHNLANAGALTPAQTGALKAALAGKQSLPISIADEIQNLWRMRLSDNLTEGEYAGFVENLSSGRAYEPLDD